MKKNLLFLVVFIAPMLLVACQDDYPSPYGRATTRTETRYGGGKGLWNPRVEQTTSTGSANASLEQYISKLPQFPVDTKVPPPRPNVLLTPEQIKQREAELAAQREATQARRNGF